MLFTKALLLSFLGVSLSTAQFADRVDARGLDEVEGLFSRDVLDAHEGYLQARDEYIEKRDLFRRLGGNGVCYSHNKGTTMRCMKREKPGANKKYCGPCRKTAAVGEYCLCNP
ncbi:unnamed protein product [Clonostachys byssicola]|uniref:Uncharacterized protein n=1 Tax=Clonostachys byssicola TaxID=160290 RepID=A0A9N9UVH5_9HYPO|nr:unnamed protein product [Clonostachys byssicola]